MKLRDLRRDGPDDIHAVNAQFDSNGNWSVRVHAEGDGWTPWGFSDLDPEASLRLMDELIIALKTVRAAIVTRSQSE